MNTYDHLKLLRTFRPIIFVVMMGLIVSCSIDLTNIYRDNLTLQEAQSLVSFQICIPNYIPSKVDPNPNIIHQAEGPEIIPEENYIRLRYKWIDNSSKALEIFQRFTNDEELIPYSSDLIDENDRERSMVSLFDWMNDNPSESIVRAAIEQMKMEASTFQTGQTVWEFFEIVDPEQYRSTKTYWIKNHVEYRILSYLPADEIEAITKSMINCSNP